MPWLLPKDRASAEYIMARPSEKLVNGSFRYATYISSLSRSM
jgi:hypothetical protein